MTLYSRKSLCRGFTFIEAVIAFSIAIFVFLMIHRFIVGTREHYMIGTVNLQNLQEARTAINYLRRDFSSAVPYIGANVSLKDRNRVRNYIFEMSGSPDSEGIRLITVSPNSLSMNRFIHNPDHGRLPIIEFVTYTFDPSGKTIERKVIDKPGNVKSKVTFSGIESVDFKLYTHQLNLAVPLLHVNLVIHEGLGSSKEIGKQLELTTSIACPFVTGFVDNRYWYSRVEQELK